MGFLKNKEAVLGGASGGYLNPSKIQAGSQVRFALLAEEPLEFYECWGEATDGSVRPFRFLDDPSPADVEQEMGPGYSRRMNREGTGPEAVKFAIAVPCYSHDSRTIQIFSATQKSIIKEFDSLSQMPEYSSLMEWDFVLSKEGSGLNTEYTLRPVPRKSSQAVLDKAWQAALDAGFDITRLIAGGNPFKEAA